VIELVEMMMGGVQKLCASPSFWPPATADVSCNVSFVRSGGAVRACSSLISRLVFFSVNTLSLADRDSCSSVSLL
jgi:hypothetical protein